MRYFHLLMELPVSNVTPIHKKGIRKLRLNYTPVSLTSIFCKIFESILRRVMHEHLEFNKLIEFSIETRLSNTVSFLL